MAKCATVKFVKKLLGEGEIEAVLQRLDRLTQDEARITVAQTLGVVHGLVGNVKKIMDGEQCSLDWLLIFLLDLFRQIARYQWIVFETIWVCARTKELPYYWR